MNIIPAIDLKDGQCVRLYQGQFDRQTNYARDPVALAGEYKAMGFEHLHVVDLDGAQNGAQKNQEIVRRIVETSNLAVQLGGGIRSAAQIEAWLAAGAAAVVVGTLAVTRPELVTSWIRQFGPQQLVLALDVTLDADDTPHMATHGWVQAETLTLWDCIDTYATSGLRQVLCTDIARDGAMRGPNLGLYARLAAKYPQIRIQASGGVRDAADLRQLADVGACAAITGRALLEGKITAEEIGSFLPAA